MKPIKECSKFCEDCGDCLECYAEDICTIAKIKHGEMLEIAESESKNYFILLGGAEHLDFFQRNESFADWQWHWTVPKTAQIGDLAFVYLCAPVSRIVGKIELIAEPFYNVIQFPRWKNNWMAEIRFLEYYESRPELKLKHLKELFPEWAWLRYPRGKTKIPAEILKPFLEIFNK